MDQIKEAFKKVKEDMDSLRSELFSITQEIKELKDTLNSFVVPKDTSEEVPNYSFQQTNQQTDRQINQTVPTHIPTDNLPFKPQKAQNLPISSGNGGVPTDRQTNQQTDRQTQYLPQNYQKSLFPKDPNSMENALEILNSLDSIKKEIRLKFKDLTDQEFLVFSTLYQLDEEYGFSEYKTLSNILRLSESSIRDYVGKLIKKDIPIEKIKVNNKMVKLTISSNLKKIASLQTILQLRGL